MAYRSVEPSSFKFCFRLITVLALLFNCAVHTVFSHNIKIVILGLTRTHTLHGQEVQPPRTECRNPHRQR